MRITVQIDVPDGELCNGCHRQELYSDGVWCWVFNTWVTRDGKRFDIPKCAACLEAWQNSQ